MSRVLKLESHTQHYVPKLEAFTTASVSKHSYQPAQTRQKWVGYLGTRKFGYTATN
jgi:hypothetical protein